MFRRISQRTASVAGTALASAATSTVGFSYPIAASTLHSPPSYLSCCSSLACSSSSSSSAVLSSSSSAVLTSRRAASTTASATPTVSSSVIDAEDDAGNPYKIKWDSRDFYERLGLDKRCTDKEIRQRYIDLAKKLHPDLASSSNEYYNKLPPNTKPEDVFKNIKEAYEVLSNPQSRSYVDDRGSEEYQERQRSGFGVSPEEYARQQAVKQVFSDGLPFFLASVFLFLGVVGYHFRSRMEGSYISHLIMILLVLTFFPRVLAVAVMYLMHCNDKLAVYEMEAQAASIVTVTATQQQPLPKASPAAAKAAAAAAVAAAPAKKDASASADSAAAAPLPFIPTSTIVATGVPMNATIRVEGIDAKHISEGNLVLTVRRYMTEEQRAAAAKEKEKEAEAAASSAPAANTNANNNNKESGAEEEEVFVFAKGITAVTIPLMVPSPSANAASGVPPPTWDIHVKFVNDTIKLTLTDKRAYL